MSTVVSEIGRFHARESCEEALEQAIRKVWKPSLAEAGCISIEWFRGIRDPRLFFVHSRWVDQAAFDIHADMLHTTTFIKEAEHLIDHSFNVSRLNALEPI